MPEPFDFVIFGSGFGGSILSMVLRRLGYSVALLERGTHPRFVIGESSTPLANLLLERLALDYELPVLQQFSEWGRWQKHRPEVACGLKRGFTFYYHQPGTVLAPEDRSRQLLVAASPNDTVADTHWYRPEFDHSLVREAESLGVVYFDQIAVDSFTHQDGWSLNLKRGAERLCLSARFVLDASGSAGFLTQALGLTAHRFPEMPETHAIFAHFRNVPRLDQSKGFRAPALPYPPDDAAVHHLFDDGWIWVLRFNNGITSLGAALKTPGRNLNASPADQWTRLFEQFPTLQEQFGGAERVTDFYRIPQLSFAQPRIVGEDWALLPSAAGFVDPLLSTGFALNLLGIRRLGQIFARKHLELSQRTQALRDYERDTLAELHAAADLISALYAKLPAFPDFAALSLLYFAALSFTESAWRLGKPHLATHFLLANDQRFTAIRRDLCHRARRGNPTSFREIAEAIHPWDIASLSDASRRNWYPVRLADLLEAREKLGATIAEIERAFPMASPAGNSPDAIATSLSPLL